MNTEERIAQLEKELRKAEEKCESQKELYERLLGEANEALQKNIELTHFFYSMWIKSLKGEDES